VPGETRLGKPSGVSDSVIDALPYSDELAPQVLFHLKSTQRSTLAIASG